MFKRMTAKTDKKTLVFALVAFAAFALLVFLFPYSGDDWAWGSKIGLERLSTWFERYNGRYAGNLLVMALTRSKLLNVVFTAFSLVCACFLPQICSGSKRFSPLLLSAAMFLLMPKYVWTQSVAWTAGFSNYIPPILLTTVFMAVTSNVFREEKPAYGKLMPVATFAIGFVASLFMENVTLYGVALSASVTVIALVKHKKLFAVHVCGLAGSAAGAVLMFSNSAYGIIASAEDGYRSTALSAGLYKTLESHVATINYYFFTKNVAVLAVISLLCVVLAEMYIKSNGDEKKKTFVKAARAVNIFCLIFVLSRSVLIRVISSGVIKFASDCVILFVGVIYFLAVCVIILIGIKDNARKGMALVALFSLPVLIAPLLVVNPIGPRCFFPPYFICMILSVCLYDSVLDGCADEKRVERVAAKVFLTVSSVMLVYLVAVYGTVCYYNVRRNEYAVRQNELGYEKITVCRLPFTAYVWTGDPDREPWAERYKLFYGLEPDAQLEIIGYKEFDEWKENFDREVSEK